MTDLRTGWAPAGRIRQPITLPEALDHEVTVRARQHRISPNTYLGQLLGEGVSGEKSCVETMRNPDVSSIDDGPGVQRIVILDRNVYSVINNRVSNTNVAFSDLAAKIVRSMISSNGNGSVNGHS